MVHLVCPEVVVAHLFSLSRKIWCLSVLQAAMPALPPLAPSLLSPRWILSSERGIVSAVASGSVSAQCEGMFTEVGNYYVNSVKKCQKIVSPDFLFSSSVGGGK